MTYSGRRSPPYIPAKDASAARLIRAFDESVRRSADVDGELKAAVCAYVGELQPQLSPERVVLAIKNVLGHVDAYPMNHPDPDSLIERVISVTIIEYFRLKASKSNDCNTDAAP